MEYLPVSIEDHEEQIKAKLYRVGDFSSIRTHKMAPVSDCEVFSSDINIKGTVCS